LWDGIVNDDLDKDDDDSCSINGITYIDDDDSDSDKEFHDDKKNDDDNDYSRLRNYEICLV